MARALMVQGTGSHVGKSVIVAALCRIFKRQGLKVAPFKAQNMALNSFITSEGGEIGRAQAYQAEAAGVAPSILMNPVLLKANSDSGAQVIVKGRVVGNMGVREYHAYKERAFRAVEECYRELSAVYDVIVIEGAGSPAEINLRENDIVNMRTARMAGARVIIASDIDKGGAFASMVGTMELLTGWERDMVVGFIINKFRGDPSLLENGLDFIRKRTGRPVLGVIPYFTDIHVQEEDGAALADGPGISPADDGAIDIAVLRLGHISNFTDFDPLASEPGVRLRYIRGVPDFGRPDLLIIPGTKNTIDDLLEIRASGVERAALGFISSGGRAAGICGGYQMLGMRISDPYGVETDKGWVDGMGVLDVETTLHKDKVTAQVEAVCPGRPGLGRLKGYELHMGRSVLGEGARALFTITRRGGEGSDSGDGAVSGDGKIWGTYIHGIFESDAFRRALIGDIRPLPGAKDKRSLDYSALKEEGFERLADLVERSVDMGAVRSFLSV